MLEPHLRAQLGYPYVLNDPDIPPNARAPPRLLVCFTHHGTQHTSDLVVYNERKDAQHWSLKKVDNKCGTRALP
jgi:hypothetical protein